MTDMRNVPGERPLKVRLVLLDTNQAGKRIAVDGNSFVVGRQDDCDLQIKSSSLSRRHCEINILKNPPRVIVRDLDSRNGTRVNDSKLTGGEQTRLFHHDVLRIGRLSFRLSIKDAVTDERIVRDDSDSHSHSSSHDHSSLRSNSSGGHSILDQLDEMAEGPPLGHVVTRASGLLAIPTQELRAVVSTSEEPEVDTGMETIHLSETGALDAGSPPPAGESGGAKPKQDVSGQEVADTDADDSSTKVQAKKEPMKLPEHFRKRSADSQEAATEALKRLFSGGY